MKKIKSIAALSLAVMMICGMASCGPAANDGGDDTKPAATQDGDKDGDKKTGEIKEFTAFHAVPGQDINEDNKVQQLIAEKCGAKCKDTWLVGQTAEEAMGVMIAGGEYPDFVTAGKALPQMIDAGDVVAIDEYWDNYPNVKNFYSEAQWNSIASEDGHVYLIPQFGNEYMYDTGTIHNDEAFWIQTRVLKWAGYPKVETLDEYFKLLNDYIDANPTMEDGTPNIGYEILCEDWRYFCLENAPFFLDGYPNDGCCIVDEETHKAIDYNTTPTAKRYFAKLNEQYNKTINDKDGKIYLDPECFTMNYDTYISKLSTGRVCGMCDQHWDFNDGELAIKQAKLDGCTYVPLGIVIDKGIKERYHSASALDVSNGLSITKSCKDVEGAMQFLNDLLDPEIMNLRFWGVEGEDYEVGEDGLFYRTQEMRDNAAEESYRKAQLCPYPYFPFYEGMNLDGKNAYNPDNQPSEFYDSLTDDVKECFDAYGYQTYTQFLNKSGENSAWFPMWSYSNNLNTDTPEGTAWTDMAQVKHEYLPKVCMAEDFDSAWDEYMDVYSSKCDVDTFIAALDKEIQRRIDVAEGK